MDVFAIDITLPRRSFDVRAQLTLGAEIITLVGPSGAGKTSLLRAIAGLEPEAQGRIAFGDQLWLDTQAGVRLSPECRRVGYLPQDYGLFPHMTVAANVRFAARHDRPDLLERLHIAQLADARPAQLSGGERQRVALARALARDPVVLLLDEPFGALDTITRAHVRSELAEILAHIRLPTLLVSHAFGDASALADRVGVITNGSLVQLAPPSEVLKNPADATVAALTGGNVLGGVARATPAGSKVLLDGGGELDSDTHASGVVAVAVQPWALELTAPDAGQLTDRVVSLRQDGGTLVVKLTRLTVHIPLGPNGPPPVTTDAIVGLRAKPGDVRVLASHDTSR